MAVRRDERGVTLLELLIAVFIIGLLVAGAMPYVGEFVAGSKRAKALADLDTLKSAITKYNNEKETAIDRLEECDLIQSIRELRDPWGRAYRLDTAELLVYSCGANGRDERGRGDDLSKRYKVPPYMVHLKRKND